MMRPAKASEQGVALVTVLMIVAAMSTVAVTLSSTVLSTTSRARAIDAASQADWLALSSEEFGRVLIGEMVAQTEGQLFAGMPGLHAPVQFTVEGGLITLSGRDGGNCFNVNQLGGRAATAETQGAPAQQATPQEDYEKLLELADIDAGNRTGLVASLVDWIDADQTPGLSGAEDAFYASPGLNYRTSGQPMADISELRAVRYYTPSVYDALKPLLCAMPEAAPIPLNINTLEEAQAPLLSLAFSGALSVNDARDLIFQRPLGGWQSLESFLAEPAVKEIAPELRREKMLSTQSAYIAMQAAIDFRGTRRLVDIVYELDGTRPAKTVWRERKG